MPTVIIYWSPGRTATQKEEVISGITDVLVEKGAAHREDVLIIFQNIEAGDAGRAGEVLGKWQEPTESADRIAPEEDASGREE